MRENISSTIYGITLSPESILDHTTDVIFVVNETGRFTYLNSTVEEILGYSPSELKGEMGFELMHPEDRKTAQKEFWEVIDNPEYVGEVEFRAEQKDGSYVVLEVRARNCLDDPSINGVVVVGRDTSERKRYEQMLERKNERLDEFASVVSHDLRNPLTVAKLRLELVYEECDSEHLESISRAIDRMENLTEDILTLAREGETVREKEAVDLAELIDNCWEMIGTSEATLRNEVKLTIRADESRLRQLLENLFRNAIEQSDNNVTITVGNWDDGFYVEGDGPGIPEEDQDKVFEAGYSTKGDGTGFGLSIVRRVVEAHGWEIAVTDSANGGARFEIEVDKIS